MPLVGTDKEHPRREGQNEERQENFDSDYDEGDAVLARGWPRNHHNLAKHGFRPVWTSQDGYPEDEIPADIQAWLDKNGKRSKFFRPIYSFLEGSTANLIDDNRNC